MDFARYESLSQINMASLENTSDCYLESLAQEGRKNDMVFLVGFCLSRIEILALTSERTQMYWERRSISSCASMLLYKCCYICVQDSIFGALSIGADVFSLTAPCQKLKKPRKGHWHKVITFRNVASYFFLLSPGCKSLEGARKWVGGRRCWGHNRKPRERRPVSNYSTTVLVAFNEYKQWVW